MSIDNSNTLYNIKYNYTKTHTGYDQRYPIKETKMELFKWNIKKFILKKNILDILENKNINTNIKTELIKEYQILDDNNINPINLNAGNLIRDFE